MACADTRRSRGGSACQHWARLVRCRRLRHAAEFLYADYLMAKSARGWLAQVYLTRLQGTFGLRRESAITGVCWEAWRRGWTLHRAQLLDAVTRSHKLYFIKIWWR